MNPPVLILVYGPSKYGKTTDVIYSFPNATFIAQPGALAPSRWIGVDIKPEQIKRHTRLEQVIDSLRAATKAGKSLSGRVLAIDDFSLLIDTTVMHLETANYSGFKLWGKLRDLLIEFRSAAQECGISIIVNAHEQAPKTSAIGSQLRGGPRLPGAMVENLPAAFDTVLRAHTAPAEFLSSWRGSYRCGLDDEAYITGDRNGIAFDFSPMNLAELLRNAGYSLPRAAFMAPEWIEKSISAGAGHLTSLTDVAQFSDETKKILKSVKAKYLQTIPEARGMQMLKWIRRDMVDRALIMKYHKAQDSALTE